MQLRDGLTATAKTTNELHHRVGEPAVMVIAGFDDDHRPFSLTLRDDELIGLCAEAEAALGHEESAPAPRRLRR
jgi:hypothetical protein